MQVASKTKIVVLGTVSKMPVAGIVFLTVQYLVGLKRLGYDVYYVEAHARTPSMFMTSAEDDSSAQAAGFIGDMMRRFDLGDDHWAFHALHADGRCYGLSELQLRELYRSAGRILNLHGGTVPRPEHYETNRLVYIGTDPVEHEIDIHHNVSDTTAYLESHCAFFTWGENHGNPDCGVPVSERFPFIPTRQPVVIDFWEPFNTGAADTFTTVASWRQPWRVVRFNGEVYHWSKHFEFMKFIDLPQRTSQAFELALASYEEDDRRLLERHRWQVRDALGMSMDLDAYRRYIGQSRAEFTVAKDQNVRLRSGWFSDRSAAYLATGRPVITQETGFSNILPTGNGLFGFSTMDDVLGAVEAINTDYARHARAAATIAREYFDHEIVLKRLLADVGLEGRQPVKGRVGVSDTGLVSPVTLSPELVITPVSRWPTILPPESVEMVLAQGAELVDVTLSGSTESQAPPRVSIVVATSSNRLFITLCLRSLLANTEDESYEVIVVDNGSTDDTPVYLRGLQERQPQLQVLFNDTNRGFAAATNQGVARASGSIIVLLNDDTIVPPGWLRTLVAYLDDPRIGLVGPVTNRAGNEAQVDTRYRTYGELLRFASEQMRLPDPTLFDIRTLNMYCVAMRRDLWNEVGALDEQFEVGMFEDEDYAMRVQAAGYRVVCADGVFVHHFGQASLGRLAATNEYGLLFHTNRRRWEKKWSRAWKPYGRRVTSRYQEMAKTMRDLVEELVPPDATVIVVSRGDEDLVAFAGRTAWHFPQDAEGDFAGFYPGTSSAAIAQLEFLRARGGDYLLFPEPSLWWLSHYTGLQQHLERRYRQLYYGDDTGALFEIGAPAPHDDQTSILSRFDAVLTRYREEHQRDPYILDSCSRLKLAAAFPDQAIFMPHAAGTPLPYLDHTIDIVVTTSGEAERKEARRLAITAVVTVTGPERDAKRALEVEWTERPVAGPPPTSIIIPCHNGLAYTEACLKALRETLPRRFRGEIIVVDDASTDGTAARLEELAHDDARLTVVRNDTNTGFVASINRGASVADGELLVFLNNDTVPLPGWLPPIWDLFRVHPTAGAVGGKLIYPDGRLQEAGGVIFADGSGANFGRGDTDLDAPLFNCVRPVDYCSGALLATRRALFESIGGFDERFVPGYYEDSDYCFAVRARGYDVYYQPKATIVHVEGGSSGTDVSKGMKQYQVVNREKFIAKWSDVLRRHPVAPAAFDHATWHALLVRGSASEETPDAD